MKNEFLKSICCDETVSRSVRMSRLAGAAIIAFCAAMYYAVLAI